MIEDARLSDLQKQIMQHHLDQGLDPYEAKLRVLCIAEPRDIDRPVRTSFQEYPRMVYHAEPEGLTLKEITRVVSNAQEHTAAKKDGWTDDPQDEHLEKFQTGLPLKAAKPEPGEPEPPKEPFAKAAKARKPRAAKAANAASAA